MDDALKRFDEVGVRWTSEDGAEDWEVDGVARTPGKCI